MATSTLLAGARALTLDRAAGEAISAWGGEGIDAILLKGVSVAEWLYRGELRSYCDADLLVDPARICDAAEVLDRLGFVPAERHVSLHAHPWTRPTDGAQIDLHRTLYGAERTPAQVWSALRRHVQPYGAGRAGLPTLDIPARAMLVALHAAQHPGSAQAGEDLARAVRICGGADWLRAEAIADEVGALATMGRGLRLNPAGRRLAVRLPRVTAAQLVERERAPLAIGLARLRSVRGWRAKLAVAVRAALPSPARLREEGADIRPAKLPAVYARRAVYLAVNAPLTVRRLRRAHAGGAPSGEETAC